MKLSIAGSDTYTLSGQTIDKLVRAGNGSAALLYLYILRTHGQSTDKQACEALGMSKGLVADATALLSRMGMLDISLDTSSGDTSGGDTSGNKSKTAAVNAGPVAEPRDYTEEEVINAIASGSDFTVVVEETKRRLGKALTSDDMLRLYGIYDNLRLPPEVILLLITHCIKECSASGSGRAPSVRYIEKAAYTWEREGVFSIERAEEYLKAHEKRKSARGRIKKALQIRDRELSETEKNYVDNWIKMGFEPEAIAYAYDKTVIGTGGLKYPYLDAILKKWDAKGLHTIAQVREKDGSNRGGGYRARNAGQTGGKKHGEPSREEMERMKRLREKMGN